MSTLSKSEAVARFNRARGATLRTGEVHFANINAGKDVWWYDIPRRKVTSGRMSSSTSSPTTAGAGSCTTFGSQPHS
jgi:hypothetical protein